MARFASTVNINLTYTADNVTICDDFIDFITKIWLNMVYHRNVITNK